MRKSLAGVASGKLFITLITLIATMSLFVCVAAAEYPDRPVNLIVPWAPGGGTDIMARILAPEAQKYLGQKIVVVNKSGGSGSVGHTFGSRTKPNGYTITMGTTEMSSVHLLGLAKFSYKDFDPICLIATGPCTLVVLNDSPFKNLADFIAAAKKAPGKLKVSTIPVGGTWNVAAQGLAKLAGIKINILPYAGGGPAVTALLGGHVDAGSSGFMEVINFAKDKKLRILAVTTEKRMKAYPQYPTYKEQGIDMTIGAYWSIVVPKGTPQKIKDKINSAFKKAVMGGPPNCERNEASNLRGAAKPRFCRAD